MNSVQNKRNTAWGIFLIVFGLAAGVDYVGLSTQQADWYQIYILAGGGLIGLAVFLLDRQDWVLIIPAYIQLMIAAIGAFAMLGEPDDLMFPTLVLALIALPFWVAYLTDRSSRWWAAIPGYVLLFPIPIILFESVVRPSDLIATYVLLAIALPFLVVYLSNRSHWWALIPAYTLTAIGLMIALIGFDVLTDLSVPAYIMAAISAPFFYVYYTNRPHHSWAIFPAGATAFLSFMFLLGSSLGAYLVPLILIGVGIWVLRYQSKDNAVQSA